MVSHSPSISINYSDQPLTPMEGASFSSYMEQFDFYSSDESVTTLDIETPSYWNEISSLYIQIDSAVAEILMAHALPPEPHSYAELARFFLYDEELRQDVLWNILTELQIHACSGIETYYSKFLLDSVAVIGLF